MAFWIAASYLLAQAECQPVLAGLADIFGRRAVFFAAVALFAIGSIMCGRVEDTATMLAGRSVQGLGGGGIAAVNLIILSDLVPLRQRSRYLGYIQLVFAIGTNTGPVIGGLLVKSTWRWCDTVI